MRNLRFKIIALAVVVPVLLPGTACRTWAQDDKTPYAAMAPLDQYMMDNDAEIALARSAGPKSIGDSADVMVLGRDGYTTAAKGTNGFVCIVERGWGASTTFSEFWSPKIHGAICFNASAARSFLPIYLMKTKLVLAGTPRADIPRAIAAAFDKKELPVLEPGSMCYMLAKGQYLNDGAKNWHPHVMVYVSGDAGKSWGANLDGSPVIADSDPEERVTIMMVWASQWSDGSPAPSM
jgi:hypothetical protein